MKKQKNEKKQSLSQNLNSDDFPPFHMQEQVKILQTSISSNHYRVFFDTDIEESHKYRDLIQALISSSEEDTFEFIVSSEGGHLNTTIDIVNAIRSTEAYTRAVITSEAHSGASFISLSCDDCIALPHSCMLIHQSRGGIIGRFSENVQQGTFFEKQMQKFYNDVYKDFLTQEEIKAVLDGKDMWLDSDEINARVQNRLALREKEQAKALKEFKKQSKQISPVKEKKTSKKVEKTLDNDPELQV
jgi:ATP-dependent protease ClpP protease subunit